MPTRRYELDFADGIGDLEIELIVFRRILAGMFTGESPGAFRHFRSISKAAWPKMQWHPWKEWRTQSLCENRVSVWTGAGAAGKTFDAAHFAMLYWMANPQQTSVVLTSTTGKMVRKRIWPVIQELYQSCVGFPGNMVDSKTTLQASKGDDKHGIFALAVADGPVAKAVANIQGIHAPRMLVVIDEATDTPEAIFEALPNLQKGCDDFRVLVIGNAASRLDPHGMACEPKNGWSSVTVEDEEWDTAGVPKWEMMPGICLHFDGLKSPNIKAGEDKWPFLFTNKDLTRANATPEAMATPGFWKYTRGFWPPDGVCKTVLSESLIEKYGGRKTLTFQTNSFMVSSLDPAFGGDRCVQRFARYGDLSGGKMGLTITEALEIRVKANSREPIHFQIARQVIDNCKARDVLPQHFIMDAWGEGGGLADIIAMEWSDRIQRVESGASASEMPASVEDKRPSKEVYDRYVTELWFSVRHFLLGSQIGGLTRLDNVELCNRLYDDKKRKIVLETKDDYKARNGGKSPDYGDSVAYLVDLARRLGAAAGGINPAKTQRWEEKARELDEVYREKESDEVMARFGLQDL